MKKTNILALFVFVAALVCVFVIMKPATVRSIQTKVMSVLSPFIREVR